MAIRQEGSGTNDSLDDTSLVHSRSFLAVAMVARQDDAFMHALPNIDIVGTRRVHFLVMGNVYNAPCPLTSFSVPTHGTFEIPEETNIHKRLLGLRKGFR